MTWIEQIMKNIYFLHNKKTFLCIFRPAEKVLQALTTHYWFPVSYNACSIISAQLSGMVEGRGQIITFWWCSRFQRDIDLPKIIGQHQRQRDFWGLICCVTSYMDREGEKETEFWCNVSFFCLLREPWMLVALKCAIQINKIIRLK